MVKAVLYFFSFPDRISFILDWPPTRQIADDDPRVLILAPSAVIEGVHH